MDDQAMTLLSPQFTLPYLYPNGKDVLSPNRRLLKNKILYNLSSGSVIIDKIPPPPPFLLRLIFFSICVLTAVGYSPVRRILSLIISKIHKSRGIVIQGYAPYFTDFIRPSRSQYRAPVPIVLWSATHKFRYVFKGAQFGDHVSQFVPWLQPVRFHHLAECIISILHRTRSHSLAP